MDSLEVRAFAMWKVETTDAYKRLVLVELFNLIKKQANQTDNRLFSELKKVCINLTRVEFECALSSLYVFEVIGLHPVRAVEGQARHVNLKRKNLRTWKKYLSYMKAIQPEAV